MPAPAGPPPGPTGAVVFVTDFGTADTYAAQMIGALLRADPRARVVAQHHAVPPQDVPAGAEALGELAAAFPPGTTFVAVIDPGVGTDRAVLAAWAGGSYFVAPGQRPAGGAAGRRPRRRGRPPRPAPAGRLADVPRPRPDGPRRRRPHPRLAPRRIGNPPYRRGNPSRLPFTPLTPQADGFAVEPVTGTVARIDRFGNLITNVPRDVCPSPSRVVIAGRTLPVAATYADVPPGDPLALVGSNGRWEIAVRNGDAAATLGAGRGEEVRFLASQSPAD